MPITGCNRAGEDVLMERCLLFFELSTDYENHLCQGGKIMPEEIFTDLGKFNHVLSFHWRG